MGIESDQLVYDYLSRVGDLAQRQLTSGDRMRLVSSLRGEIDRQRAGDDADGEAAVRRILGRLGTPAQQVAAATGGGMPPGAPEPESEPVSDRARRMPRPRRNERAGSDRTPDGDDRPQRTGLGRVGLGKAGQGGGGWGKKGRGEKSEPLPPRSTAASPPHLAGEDELGPSGGEPDWWRIQSGPFGAGDAVPGFTGGVEIPEILKPPPGAETGADEDEYGGDAGGDGGESVEAEQPRRRSRFGRGPAGQGGGGAARAVAGGFSSPFLLLAAVLLVVGAVLGSLIALGAGWLLAYVSRRLSRAEAKWAVLGLPGLALTGGIVWLWGRSSGRWGSPIPPHGMGDAISGVWPVVLRVAAGASALYLVWRARRRLP
ncbi:hypothetical protein [Streptomyces sp. NBC_00859]|uniref:hypothetical protein n=1 Tax=Streptomyces sp. NBC_00859 TaxID=2903682 RepID=UPI00386B5BFB|nr:hypothetical protein OG584_19655 [Streptomyces sp. NBC_00859]